MGEAAGPGPVGQMDDQPCSAGTTAVGGHLYSNTPMLTKTGKKTNRQKDRQTVWYTDRQKDKKTDRQTDRQTDSQTHIYTEKHTHT